MGSNVPPITPTRPPDTRRAYPGPPGPALPGPAPATPGRSPRCHLAGFGPDRLPRVAGRRPPWPRIPVWEESRVAGVTPCDVRPEERLRTTGVTAAEQLIRDPRRDQR